MQSHIIFKTVVFFIIIYNTNFASSLTISRVKIQ